VSLNTLEFTIPGDALNGGAPNEITAAVVAEAFTLALYGTGPGNEARLKDPDRPGHYVCGVGANDYFLHVEKDHYQFHARYRVPAWLAPWLTHRFGARVRVTRGAGPGAADA